MTGATTRAAVEWLVSAARDPRCCRRRWERDPHGVVLLPAGRCWDLLVMAARLGRPTLRVLEGFARPPGPVLADHGGGRVGFFVPPGTAAGWTGTGVRGAGPGHWVVVPYPGRPTDAARWLVPPDGSGRLTDPAALERALHAAVVGPDGAAARCDGL